MIALQIDLPVLIFAGALTIGTGLLFGLFPALHSTRPDLVSALKGQAGQPSGTRTAARFRASLATTQIALSMALLVSAGLFTKSLMNVSRVNLGLSVENVATFAISPELSGYRPERAQALFERLEQELAALPGVTSVAAARVRLLAGDNWGSSVSVQGFKADADTDTHANYNEISAGYFRTLGIPMLAGRDFVGADAAGAPKVAIVNEAFAKKFNLGREAVGKRMSSGGGNPLDTEIVGMVQNAKYSEVKAEIPPVFFRPYRQNQQIGANNFYVRAAGEPAPTPVGDSEGGRRPGHQPAGRESADAAGGGARERVPRSLHLGVVRGLRRAGDAPRRGRPVRRAGLHGDTADAGDRVADCARGRAVARARHDSPSGRPDDPHRRHDWVVGRDPASAASRSRCCISSRDRIQWCWSGPQSRSRSWRWPPGSSPPNAPRGWIRCGRSDTNSDLSALGFQLFSPEISHRELRTDRRAQKARMQLTTSAWLPASRDAVFSFFADPRNLERSSSTCSQGGRPDGSCCGICEGFSRTATRR